jgi:hypothetical protein
MQRMAILTAVILTAGIWAFGANNAMATTTASVPSPTPGNSATTADNTSSPDARFLKVVRERPFFREFTDADLTGLGHLTCEALDSGANMQDIIDAGRPKVPADDMGWLGGASIGAYCPTHLNLVTSPSNPAGLPGNPAGEPTEPETTYPAPPPLTYSDGGGPGSTSSIIRDSYGKMLDSYRNRINNYSGW